MTHGVKVDLFQPRILKSLSDSVTLFHETFSDCIDVCVEDELSFLFE